MGGSRKRKGVSFGTVLMLCVTALVMLGCGLLLPKLRGNVNVQTSGSDIAVLIEDPMSGVAAAITPNTSAGSELPQASASYSTQAPGTAADAYAGKTYSFSLTAGGTLTLSTEIQKSVLSGDTYDFAPLLASLQPEITGDIRLFTLENTVIDSMKISDANVSPAALAALRGLGVTTLSVGYSGIFNGGTSGAADTLAQISANGMTGYGVYPTEASAQRQTLVSVNGVSIAFLSFQADITSQGKKQTTADERAYAYYLPTIENIAERIRLSRSQGAQVVVVSLYWGKANATAPTDAQRELAQQAAEAGADIILGTHSDAVQPIEFLSSTRSDGVEHQTLCAYSLGSTLSANRDRRTQLAGLLLHVTATYHSSDSTLTFDTLTYTPTYIWRDRDGGRSVYRVIVSDQPAPDGMDENQQGVMQRCFSLIQEAMQDSPVSLRGQE